MKSFTVKLVNGKGKTVVYSISATKPRHAAIFAASIFNALGFYVVGYAN